MFTLLMTWFMGYQNYLYCFEDSSVSLLNDIAIVRCHDVGWTTYKCQITGIDMFWGDIPIVDCVSEPTALFNSEMSLMPPLIVTLYDGIVAESCDALTVAIKPPNQLTATCRTDHVIECNRISDNFVSGINILVFEVECSLGTIRKVI